MRHLSLITGVMLAGGLTLAGCAQPNSVKTFHATLSSLQEVPTVKSAATGEADLTLDTATDVLTYKLVIKNLSSPIVAAHIHGPAMPGANAGVLIPFSTADAPITGMAALTPDEVADLKAGRYYINVHTNNNKGGEIRGQIQPYGK